MLRQNKQMDNVQIQGRYDRNSHNFHFKDQKINRKISQSYRHERTLLLTLIVPELLSSYLHSQRKQYASTSFPSTGMGSTT